METLVSIIIPVFNTEKYLSACLNSVLSQTYENIEVICIDDGSSDRSFEGLEEYASRDSRVRIFHNSNHGVSYTRNEGIARARGRLLFFLDSDDVIAPDCIKRLISLFREDCAMVCGGFAETDEQMKVLRVNARKDETMNALCAMNLLGQSGSPADYISPKLFDRDLIVSQGLNFEEDIKVKEDQLFCLTYLDKCLEMGKVVRTTSEIIYFYRKNDGSATSRIRFDLGLSQNNLHASNVIFDRFARKYAGEPFLASILKAKLAILYNSCIKAYRNHDKRFFSRPEYFEACECYNALKPRMNRKDKIKFALFRTSPALFSRILEIHRKAIR